MSVQKKVKPANVLGYKDLKLSSPVFDHNGFIPKQYTCHGLNVSPPIDIDAIPLQAKSLAVIVDDPDAPSGTFCHWVIWNLPIMHHLRMGENHGTQGMNDFGRHQYDGPCPPSGIHRYNFKVYALDCILYIPVSSSKENLEQAITRNIVGFSVLTGKYGQ